MRVLCKTIVKFRMSCFKNIENNKGKNMDPLSHTTPAAPEQVGDNARPPIANLSNVVLMANLFPYLGSQDLSRVGQVCRRFNDLSRRVWQMRAWEIGRGCPRV